MTKEEIREGMAKYILVCGNKPSVYTPDMCAEDLMEFLHSQGLVIKVEKELPLPKFVNSIVGVAEFELQLRTQRDMLKAGFTATEELI